MQLGIDSSVSLHERLVNAKGAKFLEANYDELLKLPVSAIPAKLSEFAHSDVVLNPFLFSKNTHQYHVPLQES